MKLKQEVVTLYQQGARYFKPGLSLHREKKVKKFQGLLVETILMCAIVDNSRFLVTRRPGNFKFHSLEVIVINSSSTCIYFDSRFYKWSFIRGLLTLTHNKHWAIQIRLDFLVICFLLNYIQGDKRKPFSTDDCHYQGEFELYIRS